MYQLLFVLGIFVANAAGGQLPTEIKEIWENMTSQYRDECISISGTDPALVTMMTEDAYVANDRSLGCYLMCIYKKFGFLQENGEFLAHVILVTASYMTELFTDNCLDECSGETDLCLKSLIAGNCTIVGLRIP
ncbi:hypothetical protein FQR65_LT00473 [Abscondita terminalis]|nr:hypothetical protein FQR65_LT00473 [Abscondita terminalis]